MNKISINRTTQRACWSLAIVSVFSIGCSISRPSGYWERLTESRFSSSLRRTETRAETQPTSGLLTSGPRVLPGWSLSGRDRSAEPVSPSSLENARLFPSGQLLAKQSRNNGVEIQERGLEDRILGDLITNLEARHGNPQTSNAAAERESSAVPDNDIKDPAQPILVQDLPQLPVDPANPTRSGSPTDLTASGDQNDFRSASGSARSVAVQTSVTGERDSLRPETLDPKSLNPSASRQLSGPIQQSPKVPVSAPFESLGPVSETQFTIPAETLVSSGRQDAHASRSQAGSNDPDVQRWDGLGESNPSEAYYEPQVNSLLLEMELRERGWNREFSINPAARAYQIFDQRRQAELAERRLIEAGTVSPSSPSLVGPSQNPSGEPNRLQDRTIQVSHPRTTSRLSPEPLPAYGLPVEARENQWMPGVLPQQAPQPTQLNLLAIPVEKKLWVPPLVHLNSSQDVSGDSQLRNPHQRTLAEPPLPASPFRNTVWPSQPVELLPQQRLPQMDPSQRFTERFSESENKK
jgi:hypothetical protein